MLILPPLFRRWQRKGEFLWSLQREISPAICPSTVLHGPFPLTSALPWIPPSKLGASKVSLTGWATEILKMLLIFILEIQQKPLYFLCFLEALSTMQVNHISMKNLTLEKNVEKPTYETFQNITHQWFKPVETEKETGLSFKMQPESFIFNKSDSP